MDLSAAMPTLTFEVGFAANPLDALSSVAWTDITPWVEEATWSRGRQHELSRFEPGTFKLQLDDRDRRFDPTNASPPAGYVLTPMRRFRIRATWAATTYTLFVGYVLVWPKTWQYTARAFVEMSGTDALGILNLWDTYASPWEYEVRADGPTGWWRLGDDEAKGGGASVAQDWAGNHAGTYQGSPELGQQSLVVGAADKAAKFGVVGDRVLVPYNFAVTRYPFTIEMWTRLEPVAVLSTLAMLGDGSFDAVGGQTIRVGMESDGKPFLQVRNGTAHRFVTHATAQIDNNQVNHLVVVANSSSSFEVWVNGTEGGSASLTGTPAVPTGLTTGLSIGNQPTDPDGALAGGAGGTIDEVLVYDGKALSGARINAHFVAGYYGWALDTTGTRVGRILDAIGWPAADRAVDLGRTSLGSTIRETGLLSYLQALAESEDGAAFVDRAGLLTFHERHRILKSPYTVSQATLGEGPTDLNYEPPGKWDSSHTEIYNEARFQRDGGALQVAEDPSSRASYGRRTLPKSGLLHADDAQVYDLAEWYVNHRKDPIARVRSVEVWPLTDSANAWPKILPRELRERVTYTAVPPGGGATFTQPAHIERITHTVTGGNNPNWVVRFDLSATDTQAYWVLGTSVLGTSTRLGY